MTFTRRDFLKAGAVGLGAWVLPGVGWRRAHGADAAPTLVAVYLRGGADGLNLVVPAGDPLYYANRPTIQVPAGEELALDGFFGLNPALAPLLPLYQSGVLAVLHACGSPDPSRSHFDAQDFMERAAPGNKAVVDGWLNRYLTVAGGGRAIGGVTLRTARAKSLAGPAPSLAFASLAAFRLTGQATLERRAALEVRYDALAGTLLGDSVGDAFGSVDLIAAVDPTPTVEYPVGPLGRALGDAAALVRADIGTRVIAVDLGGWDHHSNLVADMADLGGELAAALAAFHADLGPFADTTLTLCMTEFGRRVRENGSAGSDHGHGGIMLALGGGVAGGRVLVRDGRWPGLAPENLAIGQDLAVTTDFRDVFAEVLHRHLGLPLAHLAPIFPDFVADAANFPGLWA